MHVCATPDKTNGFATFTLRRHVDSHCILSTEVSGVDMQGAVTLVLIKVDVISIAMYEAITTQRSYFIHHHLKTEQHDEVTCLKILLPDDTDGCSFVLAC